MSKIEDAIYEIHHMDNMANSNRFLNKIHPLVKLLIIVLYIIMLTSINKYDLIKTLSMSIFLIAVSIIGDLSIWHAVKKLKVIFILLFLVGIANPILDRNIYFYIGSLPIYSGIISMITLFMKGSFAIISSYFLIATTSIENICYALKLIHIPNVIVTVIMLIYRYMIVFLKELQRIWTAYSMRAPKQNGFNIKSWGSMIGSLMIKSIDKAQVVYESMEMRGFNPDTCFVKEQKISTASYMFLILGIMLILAIYFIPIFRVVGSIFI